MALRLDHVVAAYERNVVLDDVSLVVPQGGSLALIGPNGAGKSTLIRAVLGMVKLVAGEIEVLGAAPGKALGAVAYVPQADTLDANFPVSVLQVVLMGRYREVGWFRRPGSRDKDIAMQALERVGLAHLARERFGVLSGGQRQRVLLARSVAQNARLLLLDEPFNGVDAVTTDSMLSVLGELRASGVAVVMSTHDLAVAHLACDDCCLLNRHQVAYGPIADTLSPAHLKAAYGSGVLLMTGTAVHDAAVHDAEVHGIHVHDVSDPQS